MMAENCDREGSGCVRGCVREGNNCVGEGGGCVREGSG